ncbi:isoaspartyl dipeptidase [Gemmatimonadetes bacterium T265]|nr:isoaspartyl dipeptidase [Gemmatimonadetes bacterium T265]
MLTLLRNADVYAPAPLGRHHVLVAGERVVWMGADLAALPAELGADEIDLHGARLVPGFIDGHVHLTGGGGEAGPQTRVPPIPLSHFTRGGVTTAVGLLGTDDYTRGPVGLVAAARGLVDEGLSAWCWTGGYHVPPATITGSVRGDMVNVDRVIGVGEVAISDHRSSQPTYDELVKLAAEAHVAGLMTRKAGVVHLHVGDGARGLALVREALDRSELPARVFHPTHVNRRRPLFDEAVALARRGCTIDVTAFPAPREGDEYAADEALVRYWASGAPADRVTVSSDGGGSLPVFDAQGQMTRMGVGDVAAAAGVLRALLARGVPLGRALEPITSNAAALLRLPGKGAVAVGGDADLVVLDPAGGVRDVMARGVWHVRGGAAVRRGTFEG